MTPGQSLATHWRDSKHTSSFRSRSGRRGRDMDHWFRQSSYIIIFKMDTIIYEKERKL